MKGIKIQGILTIGILMSPLLAHALNDAEISIPPIFFAIIAVVIGVIASIIFTFIKGVINYSNKGKSLGIPRNILLALVSVVVTVLLIVAYIYIGIFMSTLEIITN